MTDAIVTYAAGTVSVRVYCGSAELRFDLAPEEAIALAASLKSAANAALEAAAIHAAGEDRRLAQQIADECTAAYNEMQARLAPDTEEDRDV